MLGRTKSCSFRQKQLYVHQQGLSVIGEKIPLIKLPEEVNRELSSKKSSSAKAADKPPDLSDFFQVNAQKKIPKTPYRISVTNYKNKDVCNPTLKDVYDSQDLEDFRKLLNKLSIRKRNIEKEVVVKKELVGGINASKVYTEFFQRHYDFLNDLPNKYARRS